MKPGQTPIQSANKQDKTSPVQSGSKQGETTPMHPGKRQDYDVPAGKVPNPKSIMPQQAQQGLVSQPHQDMVAGKWAQQVGAAKIAWGKLTDDELLQTRGEVQKLSGLIQERYGISAAHADRKVKQFFEKS